MPNHGIPSVEEFAAKIIPEEPWMKELEVLEMAHNKDTFYRIDIVGVSTSAGENQSANAYIWSI